MTAIVILRETTILTDALVAAYAAAQQIQVSRDFAPRWNLDATVTFVPPGAQYAADSWVVALLDNSDQADALGYHDLTPSGQPLSKVFVADALSDGVAWTVTASHEVLEMLGDPNIDQVVQQTMADGTTWDLAREVADAPEDDRFAYPINGVHMSAFVLPSWFDPNGVAPFTFPNVPEITAPFMLAVGGYIGAREVLPMAGAWTQRMAMGAPGARTVKGPQSRTMRRFNAA